jgi:hypothetical protein
MRKRAYVRLNGSGHPPYACHRSTVLFSGGDGKSVRRPQSVYREKARHLLWI